MVLVFFAAQFVAFFNWTNLGLIMAVEGAQFLKTAGLHQVPLMLAFILLSAVINLVMGIGVGQVGADGTGVRAEAFTLARLHRRK